MSRIPENAVHGRQATEREFNFLRGCGLPEHAKIFDVILRQSQKEGANFGAWFWVWGSSFLGFHGQIPTKNVMTDPNSLHHRFLKGKIIPFPNEQTQEKQVGYDRIDVSAIIQQRKMREAVAAYNAPAATPPQPPKTSNPYETTVDLPEFC